MKESIRKRRTRRLVEQAKQVFFEKGFSNTTVREVCNTAGCSRTTLYTYFDSKENLYLGVVQQSFLKFLEFFVALDPQQELAIDRLLALSEGYVRFAQEHPQDYQVILDFYVMVSAIDNGSSRTEVQETLADCPYFPKVRELSQLPLQRLREEIIAGQSDHSVSTERTPGEHLLGLWAFLKGLGDVATSVASFSSQADEDLDVVRLANRTIQLILAP